MHPYTVKFAGGLDFNVLNPLLLVVTLAAVILIFALPRKYAVVPFLFAIFLTPLGQQFYVNGLHLFLNRIVILATFIRALTSKDPERPLCASGWTSIDTAFAAYVVICATATLIQYPTMTALINQLGYLWDYLLAYFALRALIRNQHDTLLVLKCFAVLMVILASEMLFEQIRTVNLFGLLGGVASVPDFRGGKVRSQGVFQHALTAGAFAATAVPLFLLMWKRHTARWIAVVAIVSATAMAIMTQTSTSLVTEAAGIFAIFVWPLRQKMRTVRIGLVLSIIGLALVMKAPVWFLIDHIDLTGSSSGYQRAELINQFIVHFSSWWMAGTKNAASWGWDIWDTQNMFVAAGETGGLAAFVFFILVISRSFGRLGKARKRATTASQEWTVWLLGAALFATMVSFFGVNYFDQVRIAWFVLLSMICATTGPMLRRRPLARLRVKLQVPSAPYVAPLTTEMSEVPQHSRDPRFLE